jgi:replication factor A1
MASTAPAFLPICELSPYIRKWVIKARVTEKGALRTFSRNGGEGKIFHAVLLDTSGADIRASFFNDAADRFFNLLEKGHCFTFSQGSIKVANRQYNNTSHRYELTFDKETIIEKSQDDACIDIVKYSISGLRTVQTKPAPFSVDVCGIITNFLPTMTVKTKQDEMLFKREITVADDTSTSMTVTLWGERAQQEDKHFQDNPVVALKSVAIKEWNGGRTGSLLQSGSIVFNPDLAEAKRVREWWSQGGSSQQLVELSIQGSGGGDARAQNAKHTTLAGMRMAAEQLTSQPETFTAVTRLALIQTRKQGEPQPLHYNACQEPKEGNNLPCNKRVDETGFCATCNRVGKSGPRLNLRCRFVDAEDQSWLTCFNEAATKVLGMSAEEVTKLEEAAAVKGEAGREELDAAIRKSYFSKPFRLTVRGRMETYNGETRPDFKVVDARPVNYGDRGRDMLKEIHGFLGQLAMVGA